MTYWLHKDWKPWAIKQGIELMGEDFRHVERCMSYIPTESQRKAAKHYVDVWLSKGKDSNERVLNQNVGRFNANQFLLGLAEQKW